jgi:hypothetical protein
MPITIQNTPGDGTFQAAITLPDAGHSVTIEGSVWPGAQGNPNVETPFTGSPLTAPTPPGSGFIYWIIEANQSTGALDMQQNTTGFPIANTAGCITIFQQTLSPSNTDDAEDPTDATPDQ